ncbi:BgTH12-05418 [Blumeria graminis f. sp. triticale]|uniref:BgTH12-05416 n=1 Tax=Blumeria graminis f. sp. triticale TaxID=1689686 RepID=A0A9W4DJC8_BLUGR|nr:BgTH12-05416 [Blumeria graminis f. sp. triticale]CAD6502829.1 BgTH12-05418 [Blumeria graminis f. sp. triticale]
MHSIRLLSSLGLWLVSTIAVVQCYRDYNCAQDMVISSADVRAAHKRAVSRINNPSTDNKFPINIQYRGNITPTANPAYYWYVTQLTDSQGRAGMKYYLLTSASGDILGMISTGWGRYLGTSDTWCTKA